MKSNLKEIKTLRIKTVLSEIVFSGATLKDACKKYNIDIRTVKTYMNDNPSIIQELKDQFNLTAGKLDGITTLRSKILEELLSRLNKADISSMTTSELMKYEQRLKKYELELERLMNKTSKPGISKSSEQSKSENNDQEWETDDYFDDLDDEEEKVIESPETPQIGFVPILSKQSMPELEPNTQDPEK